jgi:tRNA-Thr(GGU) m(6)t(6)A37 methyltransferase TsaA
MKAAKAIYTIPEFKAKPIGIVEEGIPKEKGQWRRDSRYQIVSQIRIFDEYAEGLAGLDEYSHLIVIWWMHETHETKLRLRPYGQAGVPKVGIFSTRSPPRPNPLALSVVELVEILGPRLDVKGLDAWSGSLILDLKPYDHYDLVQAPKAPKWSSRSAMSKSSNVKLPHDYDD